MDIILVKAFQNAFFHSEYKMNHLPHISTHYFHQYTNIYQSIQMQEQIQSLSWTGFLSHTFQHRAVSDCYPSTTETKKLKIWLWHTQNLPLPTCFFLLSSVCFSNSACHLAHPFISLFFCAFSLSSLPLFGLSVISHMRPLSWDWCLLLHSAIWHQIIVLLLHTAVWHTDYIIRMLFKHICFKAVWLIHSA